MQRRLTGDEIRALRAAMNLGAMDFALLLGVTVRAVDLWESDAIVPSLLMSMVIRAEAAKHADRSRAAASAALGRQRSRATRPRRAAGKRSNVVPTGETTRHR